MTGSSPRVQYSYTEMAGGVNNSRPTGMTYPGGYGLTFNYSSGLNDTVSRLNSVADSTGTLEGYDYLGLDTVVRQSRPQIGVDRTDIKQTGESNGDAGDQYTGLDRFGQVVDRRWLNTSTGTATDRFQYGYDRDGKPLWRDNLVNPAFGELYAYDGLSQQTSFQRGTLNSTRTGLTGSASHSQAFAFDAVGNFTSVTTDGGTPQARSANRQNEVTAVGGLTTPAYDAAGDLTTDQDGKQFRYDAWGRLVRVQDAGGATLAAYAYDGLDRRVTETHGSTTTDLYDSADGNVVEEQVGGVSKARYVWSPVAAGALVLRDRDANGSSSDGLEERVWAQQDANGDVTALVNTSGAVVERYAYDPFGAVTVLGGSWNVRVGGSAYASRYLWQGLRFDGATGLYSAMYRDIDPGLGRPVQPDPLGFGGGDVNVYRWEGDRPEAVTDPTGLWWLGSSNPFDDPLLRLLRPLRKYLGSFGSAVEAGPSGFHAVAVPDGVGGGGAGGLGGGWGPDQDALRAAGRRAWAGVTDLFRSPTPTNFIPKNLKRISDFFAGWADWLTGGVTQQIRAGLGYDDAVDKNSNDYRNGQIVGAIHESIMDLAAIRGMAKEACGGGCFAAGTPIRTPGGDNAIEDIRPG